MKEQMSVKQYAGDGQSGLRDFVPADALFIPCAFLAAEDL